MMSDYTLTATGGVVRAADGASIPPDPANKDYQEYLAWIAAGGVAPTYQVTAAETNGPALAQLCTLDAKSVRSLRAVVAALQAGTTPDASDVSALAAYEAEAAALRASLTS